MVDQTPINRFSGYTWEKVSHDNQDAENQQMSGFKQLLGDVAELAELQARLIVNDVRKSTVATIQPTVFVIVSTTLLLGAIPILLFGISSLLVEELQWEPHVAQLSCAGGALLVAMGLGALAIKKFKQCTNPLQRSLSELEKNFETLRVMLGKTSQPTADHQL
jgi:hypothetical protein